MDTKKLLEKLDTGDEDERTVLDAQETGLDIDILDVVITGFGEMSNTGEAEFYFLGEDRPEIFVSRITVTTEVLDENVAPLCVELAVTNSTLAEGCFAYEPEGSSVIYSLKVPLHESLTEEEIISSANIAIRMALNLSRGYAAQYAYLAHRREV